MALLRSDVLNISCFQVLTNQNCLNQSQVWLQTALEQCEKTSSVEVLEITVGDGRSGWLQELAPVQVLANIRGRRRQG